MKKKFLTFIFAICLIIPCMVMFTACNATPPDIEFKVADGYIQYYDGDTWKELIAIEDLKGEEGDDGVGIDGREVEFQKTETHIQWRYKTSNNSDTWKDLVALSELKGEPGEDASLTSYMVSYDYGTEFNISDIFTNYKTSQEVKSNEWITEMPQPIEEYQEEFLGWFIKDTNKKIENYDFIGGNVTLVAKWANMTLNYENCSLSYDASLGGYKCYIKKAKENVVVPSLYNDGRNGTQKVLSIYSSSLGDYDKFRLESIELSNYIKVIDEDALSYCNNLTNLTIPSSVIKIHPVAIYGCGNLSSIIVDENNSVYDSRDNCNAIIETQTDSIVVGCKGTIIPNSVEYISQYSFAENNGLTNLTIPNSVIEIGEYAFTSCENLESISFGNESKLSKIGFYAFAYCCKLEELVIPNGTTIINGSAFYKCSSLQSVTIPESITNINRSAFSNCTSLEEINFNATNMEDSSGSIFTMAGEGTNGIVVNIGENVKRIPANLFALESSTTGYSSINVKQVNFAENSKCETIGEGAFEYCRFLTEFTIPANMKTIENQAFFGCYNLVEVTNLSTISVYKDTSSNGLVGKYAKAIYTDTTHTSNITTIDNVVYYKNSDTSYIALMPTNRLNCTSINLSSSTTEINISAFADCENLENIVLPSSVTTINNSAFENCSSLKSLSIPASVSIIGSSVFAGCGNLESISVAEGNTAYQSQNNCLIDTATKTLMLGCKNSTIPISEIVNNIGNYAFSHCSGLTSITIPSNIIEVGYFAFEKCEDLTSVTIENGLTNIGYAMFYDCKNLTQVNIPESVTEIEYLAFVGCESITNINIPKNVTTISGYAFGSCKKLESITISSENQTFYSVDNCVIEKESKKLIFGCKNSIIPSDDSVVTIAAYAFFGCGNMGDVILSTSITNIADYAFGICSFGKIYYLGTQDQWNNITIGSNSELTRTTRYYYSETQPTEEGNYWHYDSDGVTPIVWTIAE